MSYYCYHVCLWCVSTGAHTLQRASEGQKTTCGSWLSLSTVWSWWSDLGRKAQQAPLPTEPSHQPNVGYFRQELEDSFYFMYVYEGVWAFMHENARVCVER